MSSPLTPQLGYVDLLPVLDQQLFELLDSLTPDEWQAQTVAKQWTVKDVVAHLLDGNIRALSMLQDNWWGEKPGAEDYEGLVVFLNQLNADWVRAMKRVSPQILVLLHKTTGPLYCNFFRQQDPFGRSALPVSWAGESESKNWMHIAREYTEKWLHQQQIRDAVNKPGLMTKELFIPFMNVFMTALPHTYRHVTAADGTVVEITVTSPIGGSWYLGRENQQWKLTPATDKSPATQVKIEPEAAWKLFSKSLRPADVQESVTIIGDLALGQAALNMVSVMA